MPDFSLPEIHLPDIKLPDGLRDMSRNDIQNAIGDRLPKRIAMPDIDLSNVDLPKAVEQRLASVEKAIGNLDLPKSVQDRMPRRKRSNPILPIAALLAIGSMCAAAWWLITSPTASPKVRETVGRIRARMTGGQTGLQRYDDVSHLDSLLPAPEPTGPVADHDTWPETITEIEDTLSVGNGSKAPSSAGV